MVQREETILIGYSGHGKVVAEAVIACQKKVAGYIDIEEKTDNPYGFPYLGGDDKFDELIEKGFKQFVLGVGDNKIRNRIAKRVVDLGGECITIIHPDAKVSHHVAIGDGTFIARGACINPFVNIGKYCIINTNASIDHDCWIEEAVHIAPASAIAGNTKIGKQAFIGLNATVIQGLNIGVDVIIGAGTVVVKDVVKNSTMVGNPAKILY